MSLIFTALPVCEGDSFLLQEDDKNYLFDSGADASIVYILKDNKGINKLDLAICSHNDNDHAGGFKALLKSDILIQEIWLPSLWANIIEFLIDKKDASTIYFDIINSITSMDSTALKEMKKDEDLKSLFDEKTISDEEFIKKVDVFAKWYGDFKREHKIRNHRKGLVLDLDNILDIAEMAYTKGCAIKWFEPYKSCRNHHVINTDFWSLNALPISQIKKIKDTAAVVRAIYLTTVNTYSLIFEFYKDGDPIVRFSADSNQSCQSKNLYPVEIIITAPHHGSKSNSNVYHNIKGDDIIWVRGFYHSVKVCDEFLKCTNKYCVQCPNPPVFQEVSFEYSGKKWIPQSGKCCQCIP